MKKLKMALIGCGDRGNVYASHALRHPDELEIVAVKILAFTMQKRFT